MLCVLAVLSVIAVTLIRETREETRFEGAVIEDAKAEALAEGGIQQTMAELLTPPGNGAWEADGTSHQIRLGEGVVVIRIEDESGRIDLNRADLATLESMLVSTGLADRRGPASGRGHRRLPRSRRYQDAGGCRGLRLRGRRTQAWAEERALQFPGRGDAGPGHDAGYPAGDLSSDHRPLPLGRGQPPGGLAGRAPRLAEDRSFAGANQPSPDPEGPALSIATVVRVTAEATTRNGGHFIREAVLQRSTVPTQPFTVLSWRRRWPG